MTMAVKYFVFAGGRWCEVDTASGRVAGWRRRARFLYFSRGRLELASTAAVLRGLRALASGQPKSVWDGAPLSQRRKKSRCKRPSRKKRHRCSVCSHHGHCCAPRFINNGCNNNVSPEVSKMADAGVQVSASLGLPSSQEVIPKQTTLSSQEINLCRQKTVTADIRDPSPKSVNALERVVSLKNNRRDASPKRLSSQERFGTQRFLENSVSKKVASEYLQPRLKRKRSTSSDQSSRVAKKGAKDLVSDEGLTLTQPTENNTKCKELIIDDNDVDLYRSYLIKHDPAFDLYRFDVDERYKLRVFFLINPLVSIERCVRLERLLRDSQCSQDMSLKDFATKLGLRSVSDHESEARKLRRYRMRKRRKEMAKVEESSSSEFAKSKTKSKNDVSSKDTSSEDEVETKRNKTRQAFSNEMKATKNTQNTAFPQESSSEDEFDTKRNNKTPLAKSKESNAIKTRHAKYKSSSQVPSSEDEIESKRDTRPVAKPSNDRNAMKARNAKHNQSMPKTNSKRNEASKESSSEDEDDTEQNIKRPVAKSSNETRKTRNAKKYESASSEEDTDKENQIDRSQTLRPRQKETTSRPPKPIEKERDKRANDVSSASDSDFVKEPKSLNVPKPVKTRPIVLVNKMNPPKVKQRNMEYSNLEDHAIVSFISSGPRARQVNGNRVWRELQEQFHKLTGVRRTWHSLRNRYLRYILPSLGRLALPPPQVARLRAAAAAGEIKTKSKQRRNSIFTYPPVRSAFAAKRRPPPAPPAPPGDASAAEGGPPKTAEQNDKPEAPKLRILRSSGAHEASKLPNKLPDKSSNKSPSKPNTKQDSPRRRLERNRELSKTPTYEQVTRQFASKFRSTPTVGSDTSDKSQPRTRHKSQNPSPSKNKTIQTRDKSLNKQSDKKGSESDTSEAVDKRSRSRTRNKSQTNKLSTRDKSRDESETRDDSRFHNRSPTKNAKKSRDVSKVRNQSRTRNTSSTKTKSRPDDSETSDDSEARDDSRSRNRSPTKNTKKSRDASKIRNQSRTRNRSPTKTKSRPDDSETSDESETSDNSRTRNRSRSKTKSRARDYSETGDTSQTRSKSLTRKSQIRDKSRTRNKSIDRLQTRDKSHTGDKSHSSGPKTRDKSQTRTRKLFNPNAVLR